MSSNASSNGGSAGSGTNSNQSVVKLAAAALGGAVGGCALAYLLMLGRSKKEEQQQQLQQQSENEKTKPEVAPKEPSLEAAPPQQQQQQQQPPLRNNEAEILLNWIADFANRAALSSSPTVPELPAAARNNINNNSEHTEKLTQTARGIAEAIAMQQQRLQAATLKRASSTAGGSVASVSAARIAATFGADPKSPLTPRTAAGIGGNKNNSNTVAVAASTSFSGERSPLSGSTCLPAAVTGTKSEGSGVSTGTVAPTIENIALEKLRDQASQLQRTQSSVAEQTNVYRYFSLCMQSILNCAGDPLAVANALAESIRGLVHADRCTVFVADEETCTLSANIEGKPFTLKFGDGIAGKAATERKPIIVNNAYEHKKFNSSVDAEVGYITKTILTMPLVFDGQLLAVVQLLNKLPAQDEHGNEVAESQQRQVPAFGDADLELFESFCAVAGVIIHDALARPELRRLTRSNRLMGEVCSSLVTADLQTMSEVAHAIANGIRRSVPGAKAVAMVRVESIRAALEEMECRRRGESGSRGKSPANPFLMYQQQQQQHQHQQQQTSTGGAAALLATTGVSPDGVASVSGGSGASGSHLVQNNNNINNHVPKSASAGLLGDLVIPSLGGAHINHFAIFDATAHSVAADTPATPLHEQLILEALQKLDGRRSNRPIAGATAPFTAADRTSPNPAEESALAAANDGVAHGTRVFCLVLVPFPADDPDSCWVAQISVPPEDAFANVNRANKSSNNNSNIKQNAPGLGYQDQQASAVYGGMLGDAGSTAEYGSSALTMSGVMSMADRAESDSGDATTNKNNNGNSNSNSGNNNNNGAGYGNNGLSSPIRPASTAVDIQQAVTWLIPLSEAVLRNAALISWQQQQAEHFQRLSRILDRVSADHSRFTDPARALEHVAREIESLNGCYSSTALFFRALEVTGVGGEQLKMLPRVSRGGSAIYQAGGGARSGGGGGGGDAMSDRLGSGTSAHQMMMMDRSMTNLDPLGSTIISMGRGQTTNDLINHMNSSNQRDIHNSSLASGNNTYNAASGAAAAAADAASNPGSGFAHSISFAAPPAAMLASIEPVLVGDGVAGVGASRKVPTYFRPGEVLAAMEAGEFGANSVLITEQTSALVFPLFHKHVRLGALVLLDPHPPLFASVLQKAASAPQHPGDLVGNPSFSAATVGAASAAAAAAVSADNNTKDSADAKRSRGTSPEAQQLASASAAFTEQWQRTYEVFEFLLAVSRFALRTASLVSDVVRQSSHSVSKYELNQDIKRIRGNAAASPSPHGTAAAASASPERGFNSSNNASSRDPLAMTSPLREALSAPFYESGGDDDDHHHHGNSNNNADGNDGGRQQQQQHLITAKKAAAAVVEESLLNEAVNSNNFPIWAFADGEQEAAKLVKIIVHLFKNLDSKDEIELRQEELKRAQQQQQQSSPGPNSNTQSSSLSSAVLEQLRIDETRLLHTVAAAFTKYRDVPYHNMFHAFDVTQTCYRMMKLSGMLDCAFTPVERFALLLSCVFHDVDHMGLNNNYHVKAETEIGLMGKLSGQKSVLELHHCQTAVRVIGNTGLLRNTPKADAKRIMQLLFANILATDMASHKEIISSIDDTLLTEDDSDTVFDASNEGHRELAMQLLLKMADIANPAKEFSIGRRWGLAVTEEFFRQGDIERSEGREISPMCDRETKTDLSKSQIGFISFVVMPYYTLCAKVFPGLDCLVQSLNSNLERWKKVAAAYASSK